MFEIKLLDKTASFSANSYMVISGEEYLVIDPSSMPKKGIKAPKYILLTHSHFDHILCLDEWAALGGEVLISEEEVHGPSDADFNCFNVFFHENRGYHGKIRGLSDNETIPFGEETVTVMHTPGHTKGSSVFLIGKSAFVGDTVFAGGGLGRWDLPSGDLQALKGSVEKIGRLPSDTVLYPGHGESMTVEDFNNDFARLKKRI